VRYSRRVENGRRGDRDWEDEAALEVEAPKVEVFLSLVWKLGVVSNYKGGSGFKSFISVVVNPLFVSSVKLKLLVGVHSGCCGVLDGTL
jgi:ABC-type sulfate transport system permease component